jgi:hypothetical protein
LKFQIEILNHDSSPVQSLAVWFAGAIYDTKRVGKGSAICDRLKSSHQIHYLKPQYNTEVIPSMSPHQSMAAIVIVMTSFFDEMIVLTGH